MQVVLYKITVEVSTLQGCSRTCSGCGQRHLLRHAFHGHITGEQKQKAQHTRGVCSKLLHINEVTGHFYPHNLQLKEEREDKGERVRELSQHP